MQSATFTSRHEGTVTVKVGDVVGFKADIEQYGKVVEIRRRDFGGYELTLEASDRFIGEYIGGMKRTTVFDDEIWTD